jgi:hypothetical protein
VANSLIELLLKIQLIDDRQHDSVLSRTRSNAGGHLLQTIADLGYATEGTLARALSAELGVPRVDIQGTPPEKEALELLDAKTCLDHFVLPLVLREKGELLWVVMADPTDAEALALVRRKSQKRVRAVVAGPTEILRAAAAYYSTPLSQTQEPEAVLSDKIRAMELAEGTGKIELVNVMDDSVSPEGQSAAHAALRHEPPAPRAAPRAPAAPRTEGDDFLPLAPLTRIVRGELSGEQLGTVEALRQSLEKGAQVLRALAELCLEKGVFTREEIGGSRLKS